MFGPLTLLVPPILELSSAATLAYSITSLGLSRRFQTLKSAKELKRIWFKDFWSWFGPRSKKMFAPDVLALLNHAHGTVLEVGPATGIWMEELSQVAATGAITDIYGLEPNLHFFKMDQNRRKFGLEKIYHPINDDISGLESHGIQKGSLDTIITIHVLCSVENPEEVVRELYEYLKSGGQWLVYEHVISDRPIARTWQKINNKLWKHLFDGCHLVRDTKTVLEACGEWDEVALRRGAKDGNFQSIPHIQGRLVKKTGPAEPFDFL